MESVYLYGYGSASMCLKITGDQDNIKAISLVAVSIYVCSTDGTRTNIASPATIAQSILLESTPAYGHDAAGMCIRDVKDHCKLEPISPAIDIKM